MKKSLQILVVFAPQIIIGFGIGYEGGGFIQAFLWLLYYTAFILSFQILFKRVPLLDYESSYARFLRIVQTQDKGKKRVWFDYLLVGVATLIPAGIAAFFIGHLAKALQISGIK